MVLFVGTNVKGLCSMWSEGVVEPSKLQHIAPQKRIQPPVEYSTRDQALSTLFKLSVGGSVVDRRLQRSTVV